MGVVRELLRIANAKLGEGIHHFDLPAVVTCPGRTVVCEQVCYANRGRFKSPAVSGRLDWNLEQSRSAGFVDDMVREVRRKGVVVLRLHVAGDFYDAEYVGKWRQIMERMPHVRYYGYTRSWRVPRIASRLAELAALDSCRLWYSVDDEADVPELIPEGVRLAYLQSEAEQCLDGADLVFRLRRLRRLSRVGLPMVCPNETPAGKEQGVNCGSCGHCWRE